MVSCELNLRQNKAARSRARCEAREAVHAGGGLTERVAAHDIDTQPVLDAALNDGGAVRRFQDLGAVEVALRRPRAAAAPSREAPRALLLRQRQLLQVDARHRADDEARAPVVHVEDLPEGVGNKLGGMDGGGGEGQREEGVGTRSRA